MARPRQNVVACRAADGSSGLCLALVQRVAILHGARLQSLTPMGRGTRMCLALPLASLNPSSGGGRGA